MAACRRGGGGARLKELAYRWVFDLAAQPGELWPFVADTNRFNRDTGIPAVETLTVGRNARRRLRLHRFGIPIEWEEEPFEWVRPRRFGVARRFVGGPLAELRIRAELEPRPEGGTRLEYEVRARPRNLLGLPAAAVQIGILNRRNFARTFHEYDRLARTQEPLRERAVTLESGGRERVRRGAASLRDRGLSPELVDRLADLIERGDELRVERLRPYELADEWHADRREVLELFLHATRTGLVDLRWELLCPSCRGAAASAGALAQLPAGAHCATCGIEFGAEFDRSVEVVFAPAAAVREIERRAYCVGGPGVTPHVVAQQRLGPGEERVLRVPLEPGAYRIRPLDTIGGETLTVEQESERAIVMRNDAADERLLLLERTEWLDRAATAADVTTLQVFRDLFSSDAVRPGEPVSVGTLAVLFTDLRDSTRFYREVGDAPAFGSVMEHLDVLRDVVAAEGGAVVKAMGDAIMAVFARPASAVRAALAAQEAVAGQPLALKVGVHTGPCIAITQNGVLDYFGSTVNLAARLVSLSLGEDVVISADVLDDAEVAALALRREPVEAQLKGFDESFALWRLRR